MQISIVIVLLVVFWLVCHKVGVLGAYFNVGFATKLGHIYPGFFKLASESDCLFDKAGVTGLNHSMSSFLCGFARQI